MRVVREVFPELAESHSVRIIRRLERDVFPWIGSKNARQITPAMVLAVLRRIEERGAIETAHRARENCSELRTAKWADIDLPNGLWRFTSSKTKTPHIVPLSRQAIAILTELRPLTGAGTCVFPCGRTADPQ